MKYASDGAAAGSDLDEADFDHTDPVVAQDIYDLLAVSRERCPVLHSSRLTAASGPSPSSLT
jgi:hypothetical protein